MSVDPLAVLDMTRELDAVNAEIGRLYWLFTRCRRASPPCCVRPDLYARRRQLEQALRVIRCSSRRA